MEDREFVLGFIAFYLTSYKQYAPKEGRDAFLNDAMMRINKMNQEELDEIEKIFKRSIKIYKSIFQENETDLNSSILNDSQAKRNKFRFRAWSVIEPWAVFFSKIKDSEIEILRQRRKEVVNLFTKSKMENTDLFNSKVEHRFHTIEKIIQEVLAQ